jgi:hypothetical protein
MIPCIRPHAHDSDAAPSPTTAVRTNGDVCHRGCRRDAMLTIVANSPPVEIAVVFLVRFKPVIR